MRIHRIPRSRLSYTAALVDMYCASEASELLREEAYCATVDSIQVLQWRSGLKT